MNLQPAETSGTNNASDLIASLRYRTPRLAMAIAAIQLAVPAARNAHGKFRERTAYTIKVPATDDIYDSLHEWVLGLLPHRHQRALVAWTTKRANGGMPIASPGHTSAPPNRLRLRYDGTREQDITIDGHKIRVVVSNPGEPGRHADDEFSWRNPPELVFTMSSQAAQQALLAAIADVARRHHEGERKPVFRMFNKWGDWERLDDLPARDIDSVILPAGQLQRLIADVQKFINSEDDYLRRCIPWHRGHLYEGPPGTGKTSVARALATHFGMDVWYLPLGDLDKDANLLGAIARIGPRSMLLLEDVDVFHAATSRDEGNKGVTLSGLLNALDGIATPHGLLTILTTNTPDVLDPAIVRPGRVDLVEHFGHATAEQVGRIIQRWYGRPAAGGSLIEGVSPAQVVEACKRSDTPSVALAAICRLPGVRRVQ